MSDETEDFSKAKLLDVEYVKIDEFRGKHWQDIVSEVTYKLNQLILENKKLQARVHELEARNKCPNQ